MNKKYLILSAVIVTAALYAMQPSPGWKGSPGEARMRRQHEESLRRQMQQRRLQPRTLLFKPEIQTRIQLLIRGGNAQAWEMTHFLNSATVEQIDVLNTFVPGISRGFKTQLSEDEQLIFAAFPQWVQDVLLPHKVAPEDELEATVIDDGGDGNDDDSPFASGWEGQFDDVD